MNGTHKPPSTISFYHKGYKGYLLEFSRKRNAEVDAYNRIGHIEMDSETKPHLLLLRLVDEDRNRKSGICHEITKQQGGYEHAPDFDSSIKRLSSSACMRRYSAVVVSEVHKSRHGVGPS
jgi:hypothetical protein